jgi:hypothetical protein
MSGRSYSQVWPLFMNWKDIGYGELRFMFMFMYVVVTGRGKYGKVDHSKGKGGERIVAILRF